MTGSLNLDILAEWFDSLAYAFRKLESDRWWRLRPWGTPRRLRDAGTCIEDLQWRAARARLTGGRRRLQGASTARETTALRTCVEEMGQLAERIADDGWWRLGIAFRTALGMAGIRSRRFRTAADDAREILARYRLWLRVSATHDEAGGLPPSNAAVASAPDSMFARFSARISRPDLGGFLMENERCIAAYLACGRPEVPPLVSVIMPTYNRAGVVAEAIQSVLDQTWPNWELLVCDDGSEDDTQSRVSTVADSRVRYLRLRHRGAARARNEGLSAAKGAYIAYLDSDNLWHPEYLTVMVAALETRPGRACAAARYLDVLIDEDGACVARPGRMGTVDYGKLQHRNCMDLNSFVHRRTLYEAFGGFTDSLARLQDWDLFLKYTFAHEPLFVDPFLTLYRSNTAWSQLTAEMRTHDAESVRTVHRNVASYYKDGLPRAQPLSDERRVSIIFRDAIPDDVFRARSLAEALHREGGYRIQLVVCRTGASVAPWPMTSDFEIIDVEEESFPAFGERLEHTAERVSGEVAYCIGPHVSTLGLGLVCNARDGTPVVLDDTGSEPQVDHGEMPSLASIDPLDPALRSPSSPAWARIMGAAASQLTCLVTASDALNRHHGDRAFRIRQALDETLFEPEASEGAGQDRAVLLVYPPEGIAAANAPLGAVSRATSGGSVLVRAWPGAQDTECPALEAPARRAAVEPGNWQGLARLVRTVGLVVVWMDPDALLRMPVEFTAAIALKKPVISTSLSDLAGFGWLGHVRLVDFGDPEALEQEVGRLLERPEQAKEAVEAAHRLYLRQFSYRACCRDFGFAFDAAMAAPGPLAVSTALRSLVRGMRSTH
ncbi:MAG: glycosyltransferase [Nitrospiraceae bacterium]|nr:glycosyltransferase [Nitrospiraceae bacterium]